MIDERPQTRDSAASGRLIRCDGPDFFNQRLCRLLVFSVFFLIIGLPDGNLSDRDLSLHYSSRKTASNGELLVSFQPGSPLARSFSSGTVAGFHDVSVKRLERLHDVAGIRKSARKNSTQDVYCLTLEDPESELEVIERLKKHPMVRWVEPNYVVQSFVKEAYDESSGSWNQPYRDQWGLHQIQAPEAWEYSQGEGVVIAVIDSGIDTKHPELSGRLWVNEDEIAANGIDDDGNGYIDDRFGFNFVRCEQLSYPGCAEDGDIGETILDPLGHGTHVAGIIAASDDDVGITGVAPRSTIMPIRALGKDGRGSVRDLSEAVRYAVDNGAHIINASWGGTFESRVLLEAFRYAEEHGVLVIAAAGNDSRDSESIVPASYPFVLSVAASNRQQEPASFSNWSKDHVYGPSRVKRIDVSAPGGGDREIPGRDGAANILSLRAQGTDLLAGLGGYLPLSYAVGEELLYYRSYGTSMAAPFVSGVAALGLSMSKDKGLRPTAAMLRSHLRHNTTPFSSEVKSGRFYGSGIVNALDVVREDFVPDVYVAQDEVLETKGNGNGIPESGERASMTLSFGIEGSDIESLSVTIRSEDPRITILHGSATFTPDSNARVFHNKEQPFEVSIHSLESVAIVKTRLKIQYSAQGKVFATEAPYHVYVGLKKVSDSLAHLEEGESDAHGPQIHQDTVIWIEGDSNHEAVYLYSMKTAGKKLLAQSTVIGKLRHPVLSSTHAAWENENNGISYVNLETGQQAELPVPSSIAGLKQVYPKIQGTDIYYSVTDDGSAAEGIFRYDTLRDHTEVIDSLSPVPGQLQLSDQTIVAIDDKTAELKIRQGDGAFQAMSLPYLVTPYDVSVSGKELLFSASTLDGMKVFAMRIAQGKTAKRLLALSPESSLQVNPALSQGQGVWQDEAEGLHAIQYQHRVTGYHEQLSPSDGRNHREPAIDTDYVTWRSDSVLFVRAVPGSALSGKGVDASLKARLNVQWLKDTQTLSLSMKTKHQGQCSYALYGNRANSLQRDSAASLLMQLQSYRGLEKIHLKNMPGLKIKGKRSTGVALLLSAVCDDGRSGLSPQRIVPPSTARKKVSPRRWLQLLRKRLLRQDRRHSKDTLERT